MTDTPRATPDPARRSGPKLARHLSRCVPCRGSLDALAAQANVLAVLGELPPRADGRRETLVERTLRVTADEGREVLADYLYHLARACLEVAVSGQSRTRDPVLHPSPGVARCTSMVRKLEARGSLGKQDPQGNQLLNAVDGPGSIKQAEASLEVLKSLEGPSARARFLSARCAMFREDHGRAIAILTPMLELTVPGWLWLGIRWHLMCALLRSGRAAEALHVGQQALKSRPDDHTLLYNLATAHATLGDVRKFDQVVGLFAATPSVAGGQDWPSIIALDAEWFAARTHRDKEQIVRAFAHHGGAR